MTTGSVTSQPGADDDSETYHVYIYLSNSCSSATNEHTRRGAQIKLKNLQNMLHFAAQIITKIGLLCFCFQIVPTLYQHRRHHHSP